MTGQDLKNSILQLAIQGKLVEQREEEGTAKELLEEIKAEKKRLVKEKKIKKEKPLPNIGEDEIPFDIPETWEWVRFGNLVNFDIGKTPTRGNDKYWGNDYNWISIADMVAGGYINETKEKITNLALEERFNGKLVSRGTLIMSFKLTIGRVSILNIPAVHNEAIISIYPYGDKNKIIRNYFLAILPLITSYGDTKGAIKGKTLNSTSLNNLLIPLPPLGEQKRIVEKIEELMPNVEEYGQAHEKLEELNKNFPQDLQKSILQYVIQGKLVDQREDEGTGQNLYKEIQEEKERLIKEGKIKKTKPLPEITEDEIPFDIPETWEWVKFGNLVNFDIGKTPTRGNDKYWGYDHNWISIADMIPGGYITKTKEKITNFALKDRFNGKLVPKGTLIMSFKLTIGRVSILDIPAVHNEAIISIYPYGDKNNIIRNYLLTILPLITSYGDTKGAIKGKTLNSTSLNNLLIPLPPLGEQKRVVEKIEELMSLCKELER